MRALALVRCPVSVVPQAPRPLSRSAPQHPSRRSSAFHVCLQSVEAFFLVDTRTQSVNSLCDTDPFWDVRGRWVRLSHSLTKHVRPKSRVARRGLGVTQRSDTSMMVGGRGGYRPFCFAVRTNLSPARLASAGKRLGPDHHCLEHRKRSGSECSLGELLSDSVQFLPLSVSNVYRE